MRVVAVILVALGLAGVALADEPVPPAPAPIVVEVDRTIGGRNVDRWRELALERDRTARLEARQIRALRRQLAAPWSPAKVLCLVWGPAHCPAVLSVAWCESKFDVNARNGQYLGVMQMGERERERYGHGDTALEQALAAHGYFLEAGWRPWECKP